MNSFWKTSEPRTFSRDINITKISHVDKGGDGIIRHWIRASTLCGLRLELDVTVEDNTGIEDAGRGRYYPSKKYVSNDGNVEVEVGGTYRALIEERGADFKLLTARPLSLDEADMTIQMRDSRWFCVEANSLLKSYSHMTPPTISPDELDELIRAAETPETKQGVQSSLDAFSSPTPVPPTETEEQASNKKEEGEDDAECVRCRITIEKAWEVIEWLSRKEYHSVKDVVKMHRPDLVAERERREEKRRRTIRIRSQEHRRERECRRQEYIEEHELPDDWDGDIYVL